MPWVEVTGKKVHFRQGAGNPGTTPVIMIHGAGASSNVWLRQLQAFEGSFPLFAVDLSGHGASDGASYPRVEDYGHDLLAFLDALGLDQAVWLGHSMGGAIVMSLALEHPERVKKIVLAGSGSQLKVPGEVLSALRKDFREMMRVIGRYAYSPHFPAYLLNLTEVEMGNCRPEVLVADLLACDGFDISRQLSRIAQPTLILCGREDRFTPLELSEYLRSGIPRARLEVIEGAGHMAMIEDAPAFNGAVASFLAEG